MIKIKNMEQLSTPADSWDWEGQTIMMIIISKHIYIYKRNKEKDNFKTIYESVWCYDQLSLKIKES